MTWGWLGLRAEAASAAVVNGPVVPASNIDQLIAELAANTARGQYPIIHQ